MPQRKPRPFRHGRGGRISQKKKKGKDGSRQYQPGERRRGIISWGKNRRSASVQKKSCSGGGRGKEESTLLGLDKSLKRERSSEKCRKRRDHRSWEKVYSIMRDRGKEKKAGHRRRAAPRIRSGKRRGGRDHEGKKENCPLGEKGKGELPSLQRSNKGKKKKSGPFTTIFSQ